MQTSVPRIATKPRIATTATPSNLDRCLALSRRQSVTNASRDVAADGNPRGQPQQRRKATSSRALELHAEFQLRSPCHSTRAPHPAARRQQKRERIRYLVRRAEQRTQPRAAFGNVQYLAGRRRQSVADVERAHALERSAVETAILAKDHWQHLRLRFCKITTRPVSQRLMAARMLVNHRKCPTCRVESVCSWFVG